MQQNYFNQCGAFLLSSQGPPVYPRSPQIASFEKTGAMNNNNEIVPMANEESVRMTLSAKYKLWEGCVVFGFINVKDLSASSAPIYKQLPSTSAFIPHSISLPSSGPSTVGRPLPSQTFVPQRTAVFCGKMKAG
ncbi:hypothetical protein E2C01_065198 [Portunus trituberculatus]|uniref:Uncharacterized protein n=1 Tax=Portunus trituberculatus TaxID=210409 RepID=A0A5B7HL91_PORTR|nr:hypothetical protein [Portunus trituberculatus]